MIVVHKNVSKDGLFRAEIKVDTAQIHLIIDWTGTKGRNASCGAFRHVLEQICGGRGDATRVDYIVRYAGGARGSRIRYARIGIGGVGQNRPGQ